MEKNMRHFIFGTDWGEDCDDCVALRILSVYHRAGKISLDGVCVNTWDENSASSVYGFLNKEGVCVPVGVDRNVKHVKIEARYQSRLAQYAPDKTNDDAEHSPRLYRKILANAKGKVEILEVGFLNSLCEALLSEGDDISPKTGMELFKEKVEKIWIMGGKWDEQGGKEYNLARHKEARESASAVLEKCPCPITFLGWEIGSRLITGDTLDKNDYLWQALNDHGSGDGRE
jgi:inosine-uridine nucleoside N-ribohydrolase